MSEIKQVSKVTHVYEINRIVRRLIRCRNENFSDLKRAVLYFTPGKNVHLSLRLHEDVIMVRGYDSMWNKFLSEQNNTVHLNFHTSSDNLFNNVRLITAMYEDKYHKEDDEDLVQDLLYAWTGSVSLAKDIIHDLHNSRNSYIIHAHSDNIPELSEKEEQDNYVIANDYDFAETCDYVKSRSR